MNRFLALILGLSLLGAAETRAQSIPKYGTAALIGFESFAALDAYGRIMLVATAASGATASSCGKTMCMEYVKAYLDRHKFVGKTTFSAMLGLYAARNPESRPVVEDLAAVTKTSVPKISKFIPEPPGDCKYGEQRELQDKVDEFCKGTFEGEGRSCFQNDKRTSLERKITINSLCIFHREKLNKKCFRGGDPGHRLAVESAVDALKKCYRILDSQ